MQQAIKTANDEFEKNTAKFPVINSWDDFVAQFEAIDQVRIKNNLRANTYTMEFKRAVVDAVDRGVIVQAKACKVLKTSGMVTKFRHSVARADGKSAPATISESRAYKRDPVSVKISMIDKQINELKSQRDKLEAFRQTGLTVVELRELIELS